jgi:hypothetical protein
MIITDEMAVRAKKVKAKTKKAGLKEYTMYFVVFSIGYNDVLKDVRELKNVEIITDDKRYFLPRATVYKYSIYKRKKTGERVPLYAVVIPKKTVAKELIDKGVKKVKVVAEVPEINRIPIVNMTTGAGAGTNTVTNTAETVTVNTNTNTDIQIAQTTP